MPFTCPPCWCTVPLSWNVILEVTCTISYENNTYNVLTCPDILVPQKVDTTVLRRVVPGTKCFFTKSWKTSAVSTPVWMVETQLCKLRGTSRVRIIWFLWTKPTIWLLILSLTQNTIRAYPMFYPYEGYRSVTPLDAARVNRTIFHNHSVHWYYITLIRVGITLSTILL